MGVLLQLWNPWLASVAAVAVAVIIAMIVYAVGFGIADRAARFTKASVFEVLLRHARSSGRLTMVLIFVSIALAPLSLPALLLGTFRHVVALCLIASFAWIVLSLIDGMTELLSTRYRTDVEDNLRARQVQTQMQVLRGIAVASVIGIAIGLMLLTFPTIQQLGVSLFASAGIASIVLGISARPVLANLLAGVQIALTEPIRLDDVVIVEGEWGWIEEITTTYVVVRIWDLRRLVVPLSYFIENPFQNWTRRTAAILGTVYLYVDYTIPIEEIRKELLQILQATDMWDKRAWGLQVTDATEHTMQLRALVSAANSGIAWDLRCHVREKLIDFVRENYPESLPRVRAEVERATRAPASSPASP